MEESKEHDKPVSYVGATIYLTDDRKLVKKIILEADENAMTPEAGQEVLVNYEGRLQDGTLFDSSYDKEALKVAIGTG